MEENSKRKNPRGVYEVPVGSGTWFARWVDENRILHREKVGPRQAAIEYVEKMRTQTRLRKKLPERFPVKSAKLKDLLDLVRAHHNGAKRKDYRLGKIEAAFGDRNADALTPNDFTTWFDEHESWTLATRNRYIAALKLAYRLGIENGKVQRNPSKLLRMKKENNERVRYLNQYAPLKTDVDYLQECEDEETRLRAVIARHCPEHMAEFDIALHTGMRASELYSCEWININFERKLLTVPRAKHGEKRHVPLNSVALAAFKSLLPTMEHSNRVFVSARFKDHALIGNRHWFVDAVKEARIQKLNFHDLRHTFASRLIMAGVDLRTVQELMGHKVIGMTVRYSHLAPAHQLAAVERLTETIVKPKRKGTRRTEREVRSKR